MHSPALQHPSPLDRDELQTSISVPTPALLPDCPSAGPPALRQWVTALDDGHRSYPVPLVAHRQRPCRAPRSTVVAAPPSSYGDTSEAVGHRDRGRGSLVSQMSVPESALPGAEIGSAERIHEPATDGSRPRNPRTRIEFGRVGSPDTCMHFATCTPFEGGYEPLVVVM